MTEQDFDEEFLRERLHETTSGEAALRQLRRRYDLLRQEYDRLLERLERLERRLGLPPPEQPATPRGLQQAVTDPVLRLPDEYAQAARTIDTVLRGLERLADELEAPQPPPARPQAPTEAEPLRVQLEVRGGDFGRILDFQERLAAMEGVARVSISAIDHERATLIVELGP